jgi:predicted nucleotidyltransferase
MPREEPPLRCLVELAQPVALSSTLALEERLATITGLQADLVSAAALKPSAYG